MMKPTRGSTHSACTLLAVLILALVAVPASAVDLVTYVQGEGSVSPSGGSYAPGTQVTLTATPVRGWEFSHWVVDEYPLPGKAANPNPYFMQQNVNVNADLYWSIGSGSTADNVYLGQDYPQLMTYRGQSQTGWFDPGTLGGDKETYWRVDSTNIAGVTTGDLWHFKTASDSSCSTGAVGAGAPAGLSLGKALLPLIPSLLALAAWLLAKRRSMLRRAVVSVVVVAIVAGSGAALAATYYDNPLTFTINHYTRVTAVFVEKAEVSLTITTSGNGSVSTDLASPFYAGETVQLTAAPDVDNQFVGWSGDLGGTTNPQSITLTTQPAPTGVRILIVGDSWAQQLWQEGLLQNVLDYNGYGQYTVEGATTAIGGTTAAWWVANLQILTDALLANPTINIVHLSIGGNDFLGGWNTALTTQQQDALFTTIQGDVQTMVNHMRSVRPGLKVCLAGYDYLNLYDSVLQANNTSAQAMWALLGQPSVRQLNDALANLGTYLRSVSNLVYVNNQGVCHYHYGYPGWFSAYTTLFPGQDPVFDPWQGGNPDFPTHPDCMNSSGDLIDPIHVNNQSMTWVLDNCFANCYASWLIQDVPADKTVQANFAPEGDYWLNVNVIGQGLYELDPAGPYYDGQVVNVSFTPSAGHQFSTKPDVPPAQAGEELAGWAFDHWSYQPTSSFSISPTYPGLENPAAITISGDTTIYATFLENGTTCHPTAAQEQQLMDIARSTWSGWTVSTDNQRAEMLNKVEKRLDDVRTNYLPWGQLGSKWYQDFDRTTLHAYQGLGDSMAWSGVFLGALCLKHSMMPTDQQTLDDIDTLMDAIERNTQITGGGWVARFSGPTADPYYFNYYDPYGPGSYTGAAPWTDQTWLGGPSRDTHTGLFVGLGAVLQYSQDAALVTRAQVVTERVVDQLIADSWFIKDGQGGIGEAPTANMMQLQKRVAYKANPVKYSGFASDITGYTSLDFTRKSLYDSDYWVSWMNWARMWMIAALETDPLRLFDYKVDFRDEYNATFTHMNMFYTSISTFFDPGDLPAWAQATHEGGLLCAPDGIQWALEIDNHADPRFTYQDAEHTVEAALPHQRTHSDFDGQRSAARTGEGYNNLAFGHAGWEDVLYYWMGRASGAILAP